MVTRWCNVVEQSEIEGRLKLIRFIRSDSPPDSQMSFQVEHHSRRVSCLRRFGNSTRRRRRRRQWLGRRFHFDSLVIRGVVHWFLENILLYLNI